MSEYVFDYNQYKKMIGKKQNFSFLVLLFFIILGVGLACMLLPKKDNKTYFYFVEINAFLSYKDASELSQEVKNRDAAGYIYYDNIYHVLAGFYLNEDDASIVSKNLVNEYPTAKVFKLELKKFQKNKKYTNEQNTAICEIITKNDDFLSEIYKNSIKLDKNELNLNNFKLACTQIKDNYQNLCDDLKTKFEGGTNMLNALTCLENIKTSYNNLCLENLSSSKIKYEIISIAIQHQLFLSCL